MFDVENFRDHFLNLIKSNLAAKLAAITAEKADSIPIPNLSEDQYAGSLSDKVMNFSTFILYHFPEITLNHQPRGSSFALNITMTLDIWVSDSEGGIVAENKVLRYTRAISEIIAENATKDPVIGGVELEIFSPAFLSLSQNSQLMRVGGVQIKGAIG